MIDWKFASSIFIVLITFFNLLSSSNDEFKEENSTKYQNLLPSEKYWRATDFEEFFRNLDQDNLYNLSMSGEDIFDLLNYNGENATIFAKVVSECGRLRNTSSPYISDNCFKDLDFIACSLSEFFRGWKKLYKGECNNGHSGREAKECNTNLKKKLLKDMWPIYMLDSFGKLPTDLNKLNLMALGRHTDCNSIIIPRMTNGDHQFEGNYCQVHFHPPKPERLAQLSRQGPGQYNQDNALDVMCEASINSTTMKWDICAPKSCNNRNMTVLFRFGQSRMNDCSKLNEMCTFS